MVRYEVGEVIKDMCKLRKSDFIPEELYIYKQFAYLARFVFEESLEIELYVFHTPTSY